MSRSTVSRPTGPPPEQLALFDDPRPFRPPDPVDPTGETLEDLRRTSALCIENRASFWTHHQWGVGGRCKRCGLHYKEAP